MRRLLHAWARLKRLNWREIFCLALLCIAAASVSATLAILDVATTALLLNKNGVLAIGINYLFAAFFWVVCAYMALLLRRRRGYGATGFIGLIGCFWLGMLYLCHEGDVRAWYQVMFAAKYGTLFLMNVSFWILAKRFLKLSMASLKFLGVFCFELIGIFCGGLLSQFLEERPLLAVAVGGLFFCVLLLYGVGHVFPVSKEVFIRTRQGIQRELRTALVPTILTLSFLWTCLQLFVEFQIYSDIVVNAMSATKTLGYVYMAIASMGLLVVVCFARTRFLYTTPMGLTICAVAVGCCALGNVFAERTLIFSGAILFFVTSHFYIHRYLSILPRPLQLGWGLHIIKLRWLVMMPCAFVFTGALLMTISIHTVGWLLLAGMVMLALLFSISGYLYGRELMKICALRMWRDGPLMIAYPPLKQMILQGVSKKDAAEAIYFLNFLEKGYTSEYRSVLTRMLNHPAPEVRLFSLTRIRKWGVLPDEYAKISALMQHDSSSKVQNMALAVLISDALEMGTITAWHKYKIYLEKKLWVSGACMGFLYGRGIWREKVIQKVLDMAHSKKETDNLMALEIMSEHPQAQWIEAVGRLLNSPSLRVVRRALNVAGRLSSPLLLSRLLPLLDEVAERSDVLEALNQYGKRAFPAIEKMIISDAVPLERQRALILFLGRLPSGEGKQILLRVLFKAPRVLRISILESLDDSGIVWIHKGKQKILEKAILTTVHEWFEIQKVSICAENLEADRLQDMKVLFEEAMHEELNRTRLLLLAQIGFYTLTPLAHNALEILKGTDWNAYAGAVSCLQDVLPRKIFKSVRPVLLYPTWNEPPKHLEVLPTPVFLNNFILNSYEWTTPWMTALALYGWRELKGGAGLVAVKEGLKSKDWIVLETALSALAKLERNHSRLTELILSVPTTYLLKQNLNNILEEENVHHR